LEDVSELTGAFFGGDAVVGVGAAVEAPAGAVAAFAFEDELFVEGEVVASCEHFFFLGACSAG